MRKHYTNEFKAEVVLELLKEDKTVSQIAAERGIHPAQLLRWKSVALKGLPSVFGDERKASAAAKANQDRQLDELYAQIGKLSTQLAWLKKKSGIEP